MRWTPVLLGLLCWAACNLAAPSDEPYYTVISEEIDSEEFGQFKGKVGTNCTCGRTNKASGRIVGGSETGVNQFPHMIALGTMYKTTFFQSCGGALITEMHVLTAAHCVDGETETLYVVTGEHDLKSSHESMYTKTYRVDTAIAHEMYDPKSVKHDIALLVLATKVDFNEAVTPVCLPTSPIALTNRYVKITGWGDLAFEGEAATKLMQVWLRIIPLEECSKKLSRAKIDTRRPTQFCTFRWRKDSCQGDSGGPLIWLDPDTNRYTLAGVVSFGYGCASMTPGVNTDVFAYIDWIQHNIRKTSPRDVRTCARL